MQDGFSGLVHGAVIHSLNRHGHIALASADPDIANQHILQDHLVPAAGNCYVIGRITGLRRRNTHAPKAVRPGLRPVITPVPGGAHRYLRSGSGFPPDPGVSLLLKHNFSLKQVRKDESLLGIQPGTERDGERRNRKDLFHMLTILILHA